MLKLCVFWIFACLGLTFPFQIIFCRYYDELQIILTKKIFNKANNIINTWFINKKCNSLLQSLLSSISAMISNTNSSSSSIASRIDNNQELFINFIT